MDGMQFSHQIFGRGSIRGHERHHVTLLIRLSRLFRFVLTFPIPQERGAYVYRVVNRVSERQALLLEAAAIVERQTELNR